jgi:hypothetical protein
MLSDVRTDDLPALPAEHGAWRLVPNERIRAKGMIGKEAKEFLKAASETIERLDGAKSRVPWSTTRWLSTTPMAGRSSVSMPRGMPVSHATMPKAKSRKPSMPSAARARPSTTPTAKFA